MGDSELELVLYWWKPWIVVCLEHLLLSDQIQVAWKDNETKLTTEKCCLRCCTILTTQQQEKTKCINELHPCKVRRKYLW